MVNIGLYNTISNRLKFKMIFVSLLTELKDCFNSTFATINSASTAESNCNFSAIFAKDIFEYDKLIIFTPVLITLCLKLNKIRRKKNVECSNLI